MRRSVCCDPETANVAGKSQQLLDGHLWRLGLGLLLKLVSEHRVLLNLLIEHDRYLVYLIQLEGHISTYLIF